MDPIGIGDAKTEPDRIRSSCETWRLKHLGSWRRIARGGLVDFEKLVVIKGADTTKMSHL